MKSNPVVCVGASLVDLTFRCDQEPVPFTSNPSKMHRSPGGVVRNIAHHLALLNVPVQLVTILGDDPDGKWLLDQCKDAGIGVEHILLANETTGTFASIATPSGDLHIGAVTSEADRLLSIDFLASRSDVLRSAAVVIADCNLSVQALRWLMQFCNEHNVPLVVETVSIPKAHRLREALPGKLLLVKPNREELVMDVPAVGPGNRVPAEPATRDGCERVGERIGKVQSAAHRARDGEPFLAGVFRNRNREDRRRFWRAGREAVASRTARLARRAVRGKRLGREGAAQAHRDECDLSPVVEGLAEALRTRSGEPPARARAALPLAGGDDSRPGPRGERIAGGEDWRPERAALHAGGRMGRDQPLRRLARLQARHRRGAPPAHALHDLEAHRRAAHDAALRLAHARVVHRQAQPHQHAASGARPAQRNHLRRGRPCARATDAH